MPHSAARAATCVKKLRPWICVMSESDNSNLAVGHAVPRKRSKAACQEALEAGGEASCTFGMAKTDASSPAGRILRFSERHSISNCMIIFAGACEASTLDKRPRLGGEREQEGGEEQCSWADLPASLLLKMFEILSTLPEGRTIVSAPSS